MKNHLIEILNFKDNDRNKDNERNNKRPKRKKTNAASLDIT